MSEASHDAPSKIVTWGSWWRGRGLETDAQDQDENDVTAGSTALKTSTTAVPENLSNEREVHNSSTVGTAENVQNSATAGWYSSIVSRVSSIPLFNNQTIDVVIDGNTRYSQLSEGQIQILELEAVQTIVRRSNSWVWYRNLTHFNEGTSSWIEQTGIVSVYGTGSSKCPLPLKHYPIPDSSSGYHVYLTDSLILPTDSPLKMLHDQSLLSRVSTAARNYYNFPSEKHLYLKKTTEGLLKEGRALIISVVGYLPEKYEKYSLEEQRSAEYLSRKLALSLQHEQPAEIISLSIECPLHTKDLKTVFQECVGLLQNWKDLFKDVSSIFFTCVYHSVPLTILLAKHILKDHESLEINATTPVGILAMESDLQGYRFWDHSSDATSSSEQSYQKVQQMREKQLFQGVSKNEREILSKIRLYRKLDSEESRLVQSNLDWLLYHWRGFRFNFFCKLYDNFMTASQKLAVDYNHPKIFRNIWCDGRHMGHDTRHPLQLNIPDVQTKTPKFECTLEVPEKRIFEVTLLNSILLALNLGNTKFVPIMKLISPFFISRTFNQNTMSPNLKKQTQTELKNWLQEMDLKWRTNETDEQSIGELPDKVSSVHKFMEFSHYHDMRTPELMKVYSNIYDDDSVYQTFIENTIKTRSLLGEKHLTLLGDHSAPRSILNTVNQYDLVWKFHEFLSEFMRLRNLPQQPEAKCLKFTISLNYSFWEQAYYDPILFKKDTSEAIKHLEHIWENYQSWDPSTRGLKQLKSVLSVLSLYNNPSEMVQDVAYK
ncbi:hypothetical protein HG535_0D01350 [Zygotorulaspora mrakii]|uniref:Uncharacterized protein n=1 Tax=Zygotorulaspora mrakii TaxID=42260 RepID=A0A7H9B1Q9_ZYGMR|nr:uncharacterized protein HG535_0D01350 [Zygotorulaspora mrakii]QLG72427.1 hypothetical protein HG535_0D01350 [Zygotorulaspora mrakii]